ncbi:MAG: hypothetical protein J5U19_10175 [Candidatus Methanoperedens sp.]|nr:hypothetical protein [Candidatus Methanoperedens sp.]MCE8428743.1 hypothetical protein [Candidatus Methanoperedens sp.]
MKSYLNVWFNSEGGKPSEINQRLLSLGFKPLKGSYDYVYDWGMNADVDDILRFSDKVQMTLQGLSVQFKIETINTNS